MINIIFKAIGIPSLLSYLTLTTESRFNTPIRTHWALRNQSGW